MRWIVQRTACDGLGPGAGPQQGVAVNRQRMKRVLLVAAALSVLAQPLVSLPRFGKQAPRERSAGILQRIAPRPCPADTRRAPDRGLDGWHGAGEGPGRVERCSAPDGASARQVPAAKGVLHGPRSGRRGSIQRLALPHALDCGRIAARDPTPRRHVPVRPRGGQTSRRWRMPAAHDQQGSPGPRSPAAGFPGCRHVRDAGRPAPWGYGPTTPIEIRLPPSS